MDGVSHEQDASSDWESTRKGYVLFEVAQVGTVEGLPSQHHRYHFNEELDVLSW